MAERGSWRRWGEEQRDPSSAGGTHGDEAGEGTHGDGRAEEAQSAHAGPASTYSENDTTKADRRSSDGTAAFSEIARRYPSARPTHSNGDHANGPAAPLKPLHIAAPHSMFPRPLPHPSAYAGSDSNWAFTPSDTLPSLPSTPARSSAGQSTWSNGNATGPRTSLGNGPAGNATDSLGGSASGAAHAGREAPNGSGTNASLNAARSALNRRLDEQRNHSPSPARNHRSSPKVGHASLGVSVGGITKNASPVASPTSGSVRSPSISEAFSGLLMNGTSAGPTGPTSIAAVLNATGENSSGGLDSPAPALRHRDSVTSIASSAFGQHSLSHSRRTSQAVLNSPIAHSTASSSHANSLANGPPAYRVYRPPHLRTESYYALQPGMAHYDRVSAPNMRGQSRSPSFSVSNAGSIVVSRTPSERGSLSPGSTKRRLSNLGIQNTLLHSNITASPHVTSPMSSSQLDSNSLIAKLANAKLDLRPRTSDNSPRASEFFGTRQRNEDDDDDNDIDLTAEDMMMMSGTLTEQYCRSRSSSVSMSDVGPFTDVFEIGDRLGPGMMHDGHQITIAQTSEGFVDQHADWSGTQLEVVSKLGEGSYALVYLVKEVPRLSREDFSSHNDPKMDDDVFGPSTLTNANDRSGNMSFAEEDETLQGNTEIYSSTLKASSTGRLVKEGESEKGAREITEKYFALKCLCKRDLSDEMLEVQRLEATIHQSIPPHANIVTLYRTYETSEWLFLILEYCPGQDLFFWLEQAQDSENLGAATPGGDSVDSLADLSATDSTPPSPSLLASTESRFLLSRRRLRLISRMFQQICEAVSFCHSRGISHRDLKPENFVVEDTRERDETVPSATASDGVKVKLTDFGLAVAQVKCIDFDCGSKPYMSYECRNNITQWYNPIESDIWSLGIVLLNLIFHRNPFSEPSIERCPSFASYVEDPVRFLTTAFRGLKREAAQFLAEKVFCDVTEGDEATRRRRITAHEFGEWASDLSKHLNIRGADMSPAFSLLSAHESELGPDFDITSPLWHSRSPASSQVNSLMASPASNTRSLNIHQELTNMGISEEEIDSFTPLFTDSLIPEGQVQTVPLIVDSANEVDQKTAREDGKFKSDLASSIAPAIAVETEMPADRLEEDSNDLKPTLTNGEAEGDEESKQELRTNGDKDEHENENEDEGVESPLIAPSSTSTNHSKRRKRGARRGRTLAKQLSKRSRSVENAQSDDGRAKSSSSSKDAARDEMIRELAQASQSLAREMSKAMHQQQATKALNIPSSANLNTKYANAQDASAEAIVPAANHVKASGPTNIRSNRHLHPSATAQDWRERNSSQASLASISSFNTISSFSSDIGSVHTTASAPPALFHNRARNQLSSFGEGTTTVSSNASSRQSALAALRSSAIGTGKGLGTINERGSTSVRAGQKTMDASYLAEIFGGNGGSSSNSRSVRRPAQQQQNNSAQSARTAAVGTADQSSTALADRDTGAARRPAAATEQASSHLSPRMPAQWASKSNGHTPSNKGPISAHASVTPASDALQEQDRSDEQTASASLGPRKKMLGKFLQGVKSYNKGVKAAPAYDADD